MNEELLREILAELKALRQDINNRFPWYWHWPQPPSQPMPQPEPWDGTLVESPTTIRFGPMPPKQTA